MEIKSVGESGSHHGKLLPEPRASGEFIHPVLFCWDRSEDADLTSGTETKETSFHADPSRVCWSLAQGNSLQEVWGGGQGKRHPPKVAERKNLLCLPSAHHCSCRIPASDPLLLGPPPCLGLELQNAGLTGFCSLGKRCGPTGGSRLGLLPCVPPSSHRWGQMLPGAWATSMVCEEAWLRGRQSEPGNVGGGMGRLGGLVTHIALPVLPPSIPRHQLGLDTDHGPAGSQQSSPCREALRLRFRLS